MIISQRELEILSVVNHSKGFNLQGLSNRFNVNERTIRYNLDNINYILRSINYPLIERDSNGILITSLNFFQYNYIIENYCGLFEIHRSTYLKLKLLTCKSINLTKEANNIEVSRSTLKKDLDTLKEWLMETYFIDLFSDNQGIQLKGEEENIRLFFYNELLSLLTKDYSKFPLIIKNEILSLFSKIDFFQIKKSIGHLCSSEEVLKIISWIAVSKHRESFFNIFPQEIQENFLDFSFTRHEKNMIFEILMLKNQDLNHEFKEKIEQMLERISKKFKFKIKPTEELVNIVFHEALYPSKELFHHKRVKELKIYKELEKEVLKSRIKNLIPENILYLFYQYFSDKTKNLFHKVKVLIISDSNEFINNLLLDKLKNRYNFSEIDITPSFIYEIYGGEKQYDVILTCENIGEILNPPTLKINRVLEDIDYIQIELFILENLKF